ncbi:MAG: leucine-rich repeat domain-containing protein, partial [Candidatus Neoclostridium sp.]
IALSRAFRVPVSALYFGIAADRAVQSEQGSVASSASKTARRKRWIPIALSVTVLAALITVIVTTTVARENNSFGAGANAHTHVFGEYVYNGDAACESDGTKTAKCVLCDKTDTVTAEGTALEHSISDGICLLCGGDFSTEGLEYIVGNNDDVLIVAGIGTSTETDVVIPSTHNGKFVTAIASGAFENRPITSVVIPESVSRIEYRTFGNCRSLTSVTLPKSLTYIGAEAFADCTALTAIDIPEGVTEIGESAFAGCKRLEDVTVSAGAVSVAKTAFDGCEKLFKTEDGITCIGGWITGADKTITEVKIKENVLGISDGAFENCTNLISVTVPENVACIGFGAFAGCNNLTSITLPFIGENKDGSGAAHFGYIFGAETYSQNATAVPPSLREVVITGGEKIADCAFHSCRTIKSITLPEKVTQLGDSSFSNCRELTDFTVPASVTSIGDYAFSSCWSLTTITIPKGVTSIGNYAFGIFGKLTEVKNLSSLPIEVGSQEYGGVAYNAKRVYSEGESYVSVDPDGFVIYDDGKDKVVLGYEGKDTDITLPNGTTEISQYAFWMCKNLMSINIPNGVTKIGAFAFMDCSGIESITVPDGVTTVESQTFFGCSKLTTVTIPNGVSRIKASAFSGCTKLSSVYYKGTSAQWNQIQIEGGNKYLTDASRKYI